MWCKFKYYFCFHCTNCLRPTLRRFHLSEMKRISGFHYFLYMFTNLTSQHVLVTTLSLFYEGKLVCSVLRRVDLGRIYSSIAQDLKLDWWTQITWKHEASGEYCKYLLVYSNTKADKYLRCSSDLFGAGGLFS